jgi:large subunit ribosomal protein L24
MNKIKKGDVVVVIAGKDKGKKGLVLTVVDKGERFIVEGINLVKKHVKAKPNTGERGGIRTWWYCTKDHVYSPF